MKAEYLTNLFLLVSVWCLGASAPLYCCGNGQFYGHYRLYHFKGGAPQTFTATALGWQSLRPFMHVRNNATGGSLTWKVERVE